MNARASKVSMALVACFATLALLAAEKKPVTNADVIKLVRAELPESSIVLSIQNGPVQFDTSVDALIALKKAGATAKIIDAVIAAAAAPGESEDPAAIPSSGRTAESDPAANPGATASSPTAASSGPQRTATSAPGDRPSTLSYGMVTGRVQKGVTTQLELLELFGGPNTMTTDRDGTEVWLYDKTATTVSGTQTRSGAQTEKSEAGVMAAFLGIPLFAGVGGAKASAESQATQTSENQSTITRTVRNITFIIKFNPDKTVKDYAIRQSSF